MRPLRARAPASCAAGRRVSPGCSPISMETTIFRHADQQAKRVASQTLAGPRTSAYFTLPPHSASLHRHTEIRRRAGACLVGSNGTLHRVRGLNAGTALLTGPPLRLVNGRQGLSSGRFEGLYRRDIAGMKDRTRTGVRRGRGARSYSYRRGPAAAHAPRSAPSAQRRGRVPSRGGRSFVGRSLSGAARARRKVWLQNRSEQTQARLAARADRERARSCAVSAQVALLRRGA